ncbi:MAG TPA: M28 family peptidase [Candidatus Thermoplasmatota archaeon]|nr:M28 family peptidase [Candidatus Thermoplasmatota archaeon]
MRIRLAPLLAAAFAFAGCLNSGTPAGGEPDPASFAVPPVPLVDANTTVATLHEFVTTFPARVDNVPTHLGARDWLASEFAAAGLEVWRQPFTNRIPQENIAGIHWGVDRDTWVVIAGHYDTTSQECAILAPDISPPVCPLRAPTQGAYDNGSGTILVLELARAFASVPTWYTVAFVEFDGEERGLEGSSAFVQAAVDGDTPYGALDFRAMVDLDMFGLNWPGVDSPIEVGQNSPELLAFVQDTTRAMGVPEGAMLYDGPGLDLPNGDRLPFRQLGDTDFRNFGVLGVPYLFLTSDFYNAQAPLNVPVTLPYGIYPFWHFIDTWDTMVLSAGSEADVVAGFQTALDLSAAVVHVMAAQPMVPLTGIPIEERVNADPGA